MLLLSASIIISSRILHVALSGVDFFSQEPGGKMPMRGVFAPR
jgi:hypothetical protein